jgi:hypothetical protein
VTPDAQLAALARGVSAIVLGTITQRQSALNAQHSFVYSDWTVHVTRVFKGASIPEVHPGDDVTLVAPGGEVIVGGLRVHARDNSFPELLIGHQYIFYLPGYASKKFYSMERVAWP